jgi:hypothetical protein
LREDATIRWLLDGDPSIRWQTLRDLVGAGTREIERERLKLGTSGWGARLLARQSKSGMWGGGLYSPKWTSTTYTMLLLRDLGLPPKHPGALTACKLLLDHGLRKDGGINYGSWGTRAETCITGMVLSLLASFRFDDPRVEQVVEHLLEQQMPDGGWNCQRRYGATHSSVHTTISVLEALREFELFHPYRRRAVRKAQASGREFFLRHRLFRSHRTGEVINPSWMRFAFPPRWHYDILRALDYFQACGADRDERLTEAMEIIRSKRGPDNRWILQNKYRGRTFFELEKVGAPSRWNTLRALRVLKWWEC